MYKIFLLSAYNPSVYTVALYFAFNVIFVNKLDLSLNMLCYFLA